MLLAGVRCADLGSGLRARTTSAKERVGCCEAHRGPGVERAAVQDGWRQAPAAVRGGTCGGVEGGRLRASGRHGSMHGVAVKQ